jgi:uridine nucleosidase
MGTQYEIPFYDFDPKKPEGAERPERFEVKIVTEGTLEEAVQGAQTGRTVAELLKPGAAGVRIPRGMDMARFWAVLEECIQRADESESKVLAIN